jgi:N-acetyl-gamma-glutamyl-phosphate reductase
MSFNKIKQLYTEFYKNDPFTIVSKNEIYLKQVINTNKCFIHLRKEKDILLITSVIDNLVKGASGQAIQNMNLMFGIDETTGLKLKSSIF